MLWSSCQSHTLKSHLTSTQLRVSELDTTCLNSPAASTLAIAVTHCLMKSNNGLEREIQSKEWESLVSADISGKTELFDVCFLCLFVPIRNSITESFRLEKTSEIIKSSCQPNTPTPAKPCPEVPHPHGFWTPPGMGTPPPPWAAWSNAWPRFQYRNFS